VLRVNKGPVQIFRVMLVDAFKDIDDRKLFDFNSVSPDFVFKIGDVRERLLAMGAQWGSMRRRCRGSTKRRVSSRRKRVT
jgi:hypothetical protein